MKKLAMCLFLLLTVIGCSAADSVQSGNRRAPAENIIAEKKQKKQMSRPNYVKQRKKEDIYDEYQQTKAPQNAQTVMDYIKKYQLKQKRTPNQNDDILNEFAESDRISASHQKSSNDKLEIRKKNIASASPRKANTDLNDLAEKSKPAISFNRKSKNIENEEKPAPKKEKVKISKIPNTQKLGSAVKNQVSKNKSNLDPQKKVLSSANAPVAKPVSTTQEKIVPGGANAPVAKPVSTTQEKIVPGGANAPVAKPVSPMPEKIIPGGANAPVAKPVSPMPEKIVPGSANAPVNLKENSAMPDAASEDLIQKNNAESNSLFPPAVLPGGETKHPADAPVELPPVNLPGKSEEIDKLPEPPLMPGSSIAEFDHNNSKESFFSFDKVIMIFSNIKTKFISFFRNFF